MCEKTVSKHPTAPKTPDELLKEKERKGRQSTGTEFQEDHIR